MTKWIVCPRCKGEGEHVNPAVDGHGITADEMDELGPEFFEDYRNGVYNVRCEVCAGRRVVDGSHKARAQRDEDAYYRRMAEAEAGCGYGTPF